MDFAIARRRGCGQFRVLGFGLRHWAFRFCIPWGCGISGLGSQAFSAASASGFKAGLHALVSSLQAELLFQGSASRSVHGSA